MGPGWITGASDDDPSGIGTYSVAGARFGFSPLWTMLFTIPLMYSAQEMCARIAQVTGRGLAGVVRKHYSKRTLAFLVLMLFVANTINIAADISAMAAAMNLLIPAPLLIWAILFTVITLILEIFVSYATYSKYLKFLTFSLFVYVGVAFAVQIDWFSVLHHVVVPDIKFTKEYITLLVGILGTTISPYLFFWQSSSEVEEEVALGRKTLAARKGATTEEIKTMRGDVLSGMIFSNIIAFFIMLTAGAVLFSQGAIINTAADAAMALGPVVGEFSSLLFALGIIGTGMLAIPVLAGSASYALSEAFGWKTGLYRKLRDAHGFYGVITIAVVLGLLINVIGVDPIAMLLFAAVLNGIIAPIILVFILRIGNNKKIMGRWKNDRLSNFLGRLTVGVMGFVIVLMAILW